MANNNQKHLNWLLMIVRWWGLVAALLIVGALVWSCIKGIQQKKADPMDGVIVEGTFADNLEPTEAPATEPAQPVTDPVSPEPQIAEFHKPAPIFVPNNCVTIEQDQTALHSGKLLRLDSSYSYSGDDGALTTFADRNGTYKVRFGELEIQAEVVEALNRLGTAYETVTGSCDLIVYSTTSACAAEGSLYPDELPDREPGYALDLGIFNEDETISRITTQNDWLVNNAHNYGFVFDYNAEDEESTGIPALPYHIRYIGKVHACIMHEQGLTFAGYLDDVKNLTPDAPYTYHDGNQLWSVYYVPAQDGITYVPVPKNGNYEISGNNTDGYIVLAEGEIG